MAKEPVLKTFIVVVGVVATLVTTLLVGGARLGKAEQSIVQAKETMQIVVTRQDLQEQHIDGMKEQQAYQKGVVNTKLENLEAIVQRIEGKLDIIHAEWEPQ